MLKKGNVGGRIREFLVVRLPDICIYLRLAAIFDLRTFNFEARGWLRMFEKL